MADTEKTRVRSVRLLLHSRCGTKEQSSVLKTVLSSQFSVLSKTAGVKTENWELRAENCVLGLCGVVLQLAV